MTDVISEKPIQKEKTLLRLFSRSMGVIGSHTYETTEELLSKFFPDRSQVIHFTGLDEFDQPVEHYFDLRRPDQSGEFFGVVVVPLKDRKVVPVITQVTEPPQVRRAR